MSRDDIRVALAGIESAARRELLSRNAVGAFRRPAPRPTERRIAAANAPRHFPPGRSLPAPRQAAPGLCPSCGIRVTDLGLCRCS